MVSQIEQHMPTSHTEMRKGHSTVKSRVIPEKSSRSQKQVNQFFGMSPNGRPNYEESVKQMKNLISTALNRKEVSDNYHSKAYPYFLRS